MTRYENKPLTINNSERSGISLEDLKSDLDKIAALEGRSRSNLCLIFLSEAVERYRDEQNGGGPL